MNKNSGGDGFPSSIIYKASRENTDGNFLMQNLHFNLKKKQYYKININSTVLESSSLNPSY